MKVAFIHPDLGIGGAERLVVDAALGLQNLGHDVTIYTSYCDLNHCFEEVRDGTLKVVVSGDTIVPRTIGGRLAIVCASLRQLHLALNLWRSADGGSYDVLILDQLSACIPVLKVIYPEGSKNGRVLFYCHFPDQLLTTRGSLLKRLYRVPFDWFEQYTTGLAELVAVNSKFTQSVFHDTFPRLKMKPEVIYPCVDTTVAVPAASEYVPGFKGNRILLSVNRFERKKNIDLALEAFVKARAQVQESAGVTRLILAGGYDARVDENVQYLAELKAKAEQLGIKAFEMAPDTDARKVPRDAAVIFWPSIPSHTRNIFMRTASILLYTPSFEHFGIVPLEAMLMETPVLATNTGGPLETVVDGVTGWIREPDPEVWASIIAQTLVKDPAQAASRAAMGKAGRERVLTYFSQRKMALQFEAAARRCLAGKRKDDALGSLVIWGVLIALVSLFMQGVAQIIMRVVL